LDPGRIIADPTKTILNGGLAIWTDGFPIQVKNFLIGLEKYFGEGVLDRPIKSLPAKIQNAIWSGVSQHRKLGEGILGFLRDEQSLEYGEGMSYETFLVAQPCQVVMETLTA
jgi:hypothetical protein